MFFHSLLKTLFFASLLVIGNASIGFASQPPNITQLRIYEQQYLNRINDPGKLRPLLNFQDPHYAPDFQNLFNVQSYWIPENLLNFFADPEGAEKLGFPTERMVNGQRQILFLVHPESEIFFSKLTSKGEKGPEFRGTATASSRTLFLWPKGTPSKVFFAKLALNKNIGGVVRTMMNDEISRSIGVNKLLGAAKGELPSTFEFLPEVFGAIPKGWEKGGMILRLARPDLQLMPFFALYTVPQGRRKSPLQKMMEKTSLSKKQFVIQNILRPFVNQWLELAIFHGITVEAHSQNMLFVLDGKGQLTDRIAHRDFGGISVDLPYRRLRQLAMPAMLPTITSEREDYFYEYHRLILRRSLEIYFEGGFLYGLASDLVRQGHRHLHYQKLVSLFYEVIQERMSELGQPIQSEKFYDDLLAGIYRARNELILRRPPLMCGWVL